MAKFSGRNLDEKPELIERIEAMVPEVVLAVESLDIATPERIRARLEKYNVKATQSETEIALEYGCRIGIMEEKKKYRLNPELRPSLMKGSTRAKRSLETVPKGGKVRTKKGDLRHCYKRNYKEQTELSPKRPRTDEGEEEDYDNEDEV